jgi:hypothetical protein
MAQLLGGAWAVLLIPLAGQGVALYIASSALASRRYWSRRVLLSGWLRTARYSGLNFDHRARLLSNVEHNDVQCHCRMFAVCCVACASVLGVYSVGGVNSDDLFPDGLVTLTDRQQACDLGA